MKEYYKVVVKSKEYESVEDEFKGELTYEQIEPYIKTHKVPGFWSRNPHDWFRCDVDVRIIKVTEEEV